LNVALWWSCPWFWTR